MRKLTPKQQQFVDAYNGSIKETAAAIGMNYEYARKLCTTNQYMIETLRDRQNKSIKPTIATREHRQKFWTDVMRDSKESMSNRLRAAELLGKSEADFTENIKQDTTLTVNRKTYGT